MNMIERSQRILAVGKESLDGADLFELRCRLEEATTHVELDALEEYVEHCAEEVDD